MSKCDKIPIELVLATTDPDLYDETQNKWRWSSTMYWAVECLATGQSTVSDRVAPAIDPESYLPLTKSPSTWNFCLSKQCQNGSTLVHLVFTFDPKSTDPNNYLQFVVTVYGQVTDHPQHSIKDKNGENVYLNIVELGKMISQPYVEIWIAKTAGIVMDEEGGLMLTAPISDDSGGGNWLWIAVIVILLLFFIAGGGWWLWQRQSEKPSVGNIG